VNPTTTTKHYNKAKTFAAADRHSGRMERMLLQAERAVKVGGQHT